MGEIQPRPVNLEVGTRDFKYYVFDWDDNILHMPTRIYLEKRGADGQWRAVTVSTGTFALVRGDTAHYRFPLEGGRDAAFRDFQDGAADPVTGDLAFIRDTKAALARIKAGAAPGPSFETMRKTLREGRIFAIVTARGHAPETLRAAVELFIAEVLTPDEREEMLANLRGYRTVFDKVAQTGTDEEELDYYLSMCRYHAVTWPGFSERVKEDGAFGGKFASASSRHKPEVAKEFAIKDFVDHVFRTLRRNGGLGMRQIAVGFSDDDPGNVKAVSEFIRSELSRRYGSCKFVVYDTGSSAGAERKVTISGQLDLPGF